MTERDRDAADAFSVIGNERRVDILRALMDAYREDETPIAYSRLLSRTGTSDSGQFNYHLQKLLGRFVSETDDGYALTYAGRTVVSAIASGTFDRSFSLDPEPVAGTCYACGADALVLRYPGTRVRVSCGACEEEVVHIQFPPSGVADRTPSELKRAFDRWARSWRSLAGAGICPECSGEMRGTLGRDAGTPATGNVPVRAVVSCERCWVRAFLPPGILALDHPGVTAFFWDRGIDVRERPLWRHEWALAADAQTVVSEDPLRVRIDIAVDDATLSVTVGNDLTVESIVERRDC